MAQNANVAISTSATSGGSWSGSGPYTFTPTSNSANIQASDLQTKIIAANVTILTTCGSCTQTGNVTTSTTVTAAQTGTTQRTLTITAGGSITLSQAFNFTSATSGTNNTGRPGPNVILTAGTNANITISAPLTTTAASRGTPTTGGAAGDITLTTSGTGAISVSATITATGSSGTTGGAGGDMSFTGAGGITLSASLTANAGSGGSPAKGNFTFNDGNATVTSGGVNDGQTAASVIAGGNLTKSGSGTFDMDGSNTYTGTTTITAGILRASTTNVVNSSAGPFGNSTSNVILNGGTLQSNVGTFSKPIQVSATNSTLDAFGSARSLTSTITTSVAGTYNLNIGANTVASAGGQDLTLATGVISNGTGTLGLTKTGSSKAILSATNTFTGGLTLAAGTLNVNNTQALGGAAGTFTITGGTLDASAALTTVSYPIALNGDFTFTGTNNLNLGTGTVTMSANRQITVTANILTLGGAISQSSLDLTKAGAGTLALGSNTVSLDALTISAGTFTSTSNTLTLAGDFSNSGTFTHNSGTATFSGATQNIGTATFNNLTLSGSGDKTMTGAATVAGVITITTGRILSIGANTLTLNGTIDGSNTGKITGGTTSNIVIGANGSTDVGILTMNTASSSTMTLNNLTLNRVAGADALILGDGLRIAGVLTIADGATLTTNNFLTFASSSNTSSGQLAAMTGTAAISGNVTVERFILGGTNTRRWRFLSSPVTTTTKISGNWQQNIHITGTGTGGTTCPSLTAHTNGFDPTLTNYSSMYVYNKNTQAWEAITGTNNTELTPSTGYRALIRGARSQGCNLLTSQSTTPADVTLSATGTIVTGTQTITCAGTANQWTFIGNPFQATIDLASLTYTNLKTTIWGFNPTQGLVGAWGSYVTSPVDQTNGMTQYVPAGSSFIVQTNTTAAASLGIPETAKATAQGGHGLFKTVVDSVPNRLRVQLFSPDATIGMLDESVVRFLSGATWGFDDSLDAMKYGFDLSSIEYVPNQVAVYTASSPVRLGISRLKPLSGGEVDTVFLHVNVNTPGTYKLKFATVNTYDPLYAVMLVDKQKGIVQNLRKQSEYLMEITSDSNTGAPGRLMLILGDTAKLTEPLTNALKGITDIKSAVKLYPIPVDHQLTIEASDYFNLEEYNVSIYDIFGRKITLPFTTNNGKYLFDMSTLQKGVYIVELDGIHSQGLFRYGVVKS